MAAGQSGIIAVVDSSERRPKLIHGALNRCRGRAGCLEYDWGYELLCGKIIGLCRGWLCQYQAGNQTSGGEQSHEQHGLALACNVLINFSFLVTASCVSTVSRSLLTTEDRGMFVKTVFSAL